MWAAGLPEKMTLLVMLTMVMLTMVMLTMTAEPACMYRGPHQRSMLQPHSPCFTACEDRHYCPDFKTGRLRPRDGEQPRLPGEQGWARVLSPAPVPHRAAGSHWARSKREGA